VNEQTMTLAMERASASLTTDVAALVAGGTARGRARRRRRIAGATAVAASAVLAVALAPALVTTGHGPSPAPASEPTRTPIARGAMDATLLALLPGSHLAADAPQSTRLPDDPYDPQVQQATVTWHGATVGVSIDTRGAGAETSAAQRCASLADGQSCHEEADGSWSFAHSMYSLETSTDEMGSGTRLLNVYTADGYVVTAASTPASGAVGADELRDLALSEAWWD